MATIEKYATKSGTRWRVRYRTPDRKQTDKRGFKTKRDAEAFAATVEVQKLTGTFVSYRAGRTTVGEVAETWKTITKASKSPTSWRNYETAWRLHVEPRWSSVSIGDIDLTAVNTWIATMERRDGRDGRPSAPTVERAYTVLLGVLDTAVKSRLIGVNPARGAELPDREKQRRVYLKPAEVARLAEKAGEHGDLVLTLAYTGLRWGEAVALRWDAVDLGAGRFTVDKSVTQNGTTLVEGTPKTGDARSVPVPRFLVERLRERTATSATSATSGLVFPGADGEYMRQPDVRRGWFARAVRDAGLPRMRIHDLRHTCASLAVSSGANVKALQRMLGHARASMTLDVYADLFDSDLDSVAEALHRAHTTS